MSELLRLSHQLKHGCPRQKVIAWQKLVALDENALSGTEVANAGLVPLLVALLEQVPSHKRAEVQNQAACLLLEAAACDPGMEELLHRNCAAQLTAALLSGSFVKKARVTAILGIVSISMQQQQKASQMLQYCQTMMILSASSVPEVVKVLSQAGCADAASLAMTLKGLEALLQGAIPVKFFVKAGGVEVFARLLFKVSDCEPESLSSPPDKDSKDASESAISAEVWSAAMGILNLVVLHSPEGSKRITQGALLPILLQCSSSVFLEVQMLALTALNNLAAVPDHLPAFSRVGGEIQHLGLALQSPHLPTQTEALKCIKLVSPFISGFSEQQLVCMLNSLTGSDAVQDKCESSDSSNDLA